jgi:hypothetical protein
MDPRVYQKPRKSVRRKYVGCQQPRDPVHLTAKSILTLLLAPNCFHRVPRSELVAGIFLLPVELCGRPGARPVEIGIHRTQLVTKFDLKLRRLKPLQMDGRSTP